MKRKKRKIKEMNRKLGEKCENKVRKYNFN